MPHRLFSVLEERLTSQCGTPLHSWTKYRFRVRVQGLDPSSTGTGVRCEWLPPGHQAPEIINGQERSFTEISNASFTGSRAFFLRYSIAQITTHWVFPSRTQLLCRLRRLHANLTVHSPIIADCKISAADRGPRRRLCSAYAIPVAAHEDRFSSWMIPPSATSSCRLDRHGPAPGIALVGSSPLNTIIIVARLRV
ncbi:hypothetical protein BJV74DRAFT_609866 [Russula compacta]|nr:hypothetical protein BJV74DRAFT_609866 [Russula compacta]